MKVGVLAVQGNFRELNGGLVRAEAVKPPVRVSGQGEGVPGEPGGSPVTRAKREGNVDVRT
jgi:glutamine amidotransferase PdxT